MARGLGGQSPSNVTQYLGGIDFPCEKENLVEHARKNKAEEAVIEALEALPDREYTSMSDVMEGYGETHGATQSSGGQSGGQSSSRR